MSISKAEFTDLVKDFKLKELFVDLGWNNENIDMQSMQIDEAVLSPRVIAGKSGFKVIECQSEKIPVYTDRAKAAIVIKRLFNESLLIFTDAKNTEQVWLYHYTHKSKNKKSEILWKQGQSVERLYQRASGMIFELDQYGKITIIDVSALVRSNFAANAEGVTKQFYNSFKRQHVALLGFISGIKAHGDKEWYASIMLNRLMFCYFMQKRGFLNNDRNYLRNKLTESKERLGKGKFYSFYRSFLLVLFQKGFGAYTHPPEIEEMIGKVPYLNGGLFDLHAIERDSPKIDIKDEAFESIFNLFDQYEWHLDTREGAAGNEINPDVLGYIFEKYINDRSSMGAYYTQEDITEYISRSTILPWLLERTKKACPKAFSTDGPVWAFLKGSGDEYIFDSVKHGAALPDYIAIGLDTEAPGLLERRKRWNEPAPLEYALPTEIWREVAERRKRYENVRALIEGGKITEVADFVTHNLDIVRFVGDLLGNIEDPRFIHAFYACLEKITILDPTCGSGAFLFAALEILQPLYDLCLARMEDYLAHDYKGILDRDIKSDFKKVLGLMWSGVHPSKPYFIHKSIILNNLYGVDIMREAVETAKLRLFLKLVSTVEPDYGGANLGIEPLPDIDFNIKAGNSLIGYASEKEVDAALGHLYSQGMKSETKDAMAQLAMATERYKQLQLGAGDYKSKEFVQEKAELLSRESKLRGTLDGVLRAGAYMDTSDSAWEANYMPFHWVSEFYRIIVGNGGFDVIIGNPPYLEARQIDYQLHNYLTMNAGTVHSFCVERAFQISNSVSNVSMIVPLSLVSTQRMIAARDIIENKKTVYYSNFAWRPGKLFDTVNRALTIFLSFPSKITKIKQFTTKYIKWNSENRYTLFDLCYYTLSDNQLSNKTYWIGKLGDSIDNNIINKIILSQQIVRSLVISSGIPIYYKATGGLYWKVLTNFAPEFYVNEVKGHSSRETTITVSNKPESLKLIALLSSSTFWWWYTLTSNLRDLNPSDILNFFLPGKWDSIDNLINVATEYLESLILNSQWLERRQRTVGHTKVQSFKISAS